MKKNNPTLTIDLLKSCFPFVVITITIFTFNFNSIFSEILIQGDFKLTQPEFAQWQYNMNAIIGRGLAVTTFISYLTFNYFYPLSPSIARLFNVICGMIPLAFLCFYLYRKCFKLPPMAALVAAILPQVLPNITLIPMFINGGYFIFAQIPAVIFFIFLIKYFRDQSDKAGRIALASYVLGLLSTELTLFFLIPAALLAFFYCQSLRRLLVFTKLIALISALKLLWYLSQTHTIANKVVLQSSSAIDSRLSKLFWAIMPLNLPEFSLTFYLYILAALAVCSFIFGCHLQSNTYLPHNNNATSIKAQWKIACIFGFSWLIAAFIPFVFISSHPFSDRYAYPSGLGLSLSLVTIFYCLCPKKITTKYFLDIFFMTLLLSAGLQRLSIIEKTYQPIEKLHCSLKTALHKHTFPPQTQIVIVGKQLLALRTAGVKSWSSGCLQHILGRNDVSGLVGPKYSFYNPFQTVDKEFLNKNKMIGLDLRRPLFLFEYIHEAGELRQYQYALLWRNTTHWLIIKVDVKSGRINTFRKSAGTITFKNALEQLSLQGLEPSKIYWYFGDKT